MTIELEDDEVTTMLIVLGMATAIAMSSGTKEAVPPLRMLIGKIAPDSYWALTKPKDSQWSEVDEKGR